MSDGDIYWLAIQFTESSLKYWNYQQICFFCYSRNAVASANFYYLLWGSTANNSISCKENQSIVRVKTTIWLCAIIVLVLNLRSCIICCCKVYSFSISQSNWSDICIRLVDVANLSINIIPYAYSYWYCLHIQMKLLYSQKKHSLSGRGYINGCYWDNTTFNCNKL